MLEKAIQRWLVTMDAVTQPQQPTPLPQSRSRSPVHAAAYWFSRVPTSKGLIGITKSGYVSFDQAEIRLMELHQAGDLEANSEFVELFIALSAESVPRVRAALDSGLVFSQKRKHVDLRSLVLDLEEDQRQCVLEHIHETCTPPADRTKGFVVLSDVDDTILPAHDVLNVAGSDRSWVLDGQLYPGVAQLHVELRGNLGRNRDYPVLLTARPPLLVMALPSKLGKITDQERPRMSILPGEGGLNVPMNLLRIFANNYTELGTAKVSRMIEYASLFPDYTGRFVFIGDDGQADADAAVEMLGLTGPRLRGCSGKTDSEETTPLVAFVAIHAVQNRKHTLLPKHKSKEMYTFKAHVPEAQRLARVLQVRRQYGPLGADAGRHRFFYFLNYVDLAQQLKTAGWLEPTQSETVINAAMEEVAPRQHRARSTF